MAILHAWLSTQTEANNANLNAKYVGVAEEKSVEKIARLEREKRH